MTAARRILSVFFLLAGTLVVAPLAAQDEPSQPDISRIEELRARAEERASGLEPEIVPSELLGEEGVEVQQRALAAYYQYRIDGYQHRQRVFRWQLFSSRIIFVMVILLVFVGVYFSWLQFRSAMRSGTAPSEQQETTFEASASGFKVSSPVLGVIILAISLAFFYLYLVHVYPIVDRL